MPYKILPDGKVEPLKLSPEDVLKIVKEAGVKFIDLQFTDGPGRLQHTTITVDVLTREVFEQGVPKLDGSSIRGFVEIQESDMVLKPDPNTFAIIPWIPQEMKTARMICDIYRGFGMGRLTRDPRYIAQRAEEYLRQEGFDFSYWGPELEFFVFDKVTWDVMMPYKGMSYRIESREAIWAPTGSSYPIRFKEGYFPAPPQDTLMEYRNECVQVLRDYFNILSTTHHHEVATAGQCEIDMLHDTLTNMADGVITCKFVTKNIAVKRGMIVTFMPKPIFMDNASGMHVHVSIWKGGQNVFYDPDDEYAELSQIGRYFVGGLIEHARSLSAIVSPTTNSYKRLVPGYEAPVYAAWSRSNRSAAIRIPAYHRKSPKTKRVEYRPPDPAANPYFCFAAMLAAGLDGIKKKIDPGDPVDENIYHMTPERRKQMGIKELPGSLKEAIDELVSDQEYLKPIFAQDAIDKIVENALKEYNEVAMRPHPYEFHLYFDI